MSAENPIVNRGLLRLYDLGTRVGPQRDPVAATARRAEWRAALADHNREPKAWMRS